MRERVPDPAVCLFCGQPRDCAKDTPDKRHFPHCADDLCKRKSMHEYQAKYRWDKRGSGKPYVFNEPLYLKLKPDEIEAWRTEFNSHCLPLESGCIRWQGSYSSNGTPYVSCNSQTITARRVSWLLHYSRLMKDFSVHVRCKKAWCVRFEHLYISGAKRVKLARAQAAKERDARREEKIAGSLEKPRWIHDEARNIYVYAPSLAKREIHLEDGMYRAYINDIRRRAFDDIGRAKAWTFDASTVRDTEVSLNEKTGDLDDID